MKHQDDFHDELLSGYLDGELSADEQGLVEHALAENSELRHTYDELRALRSTLQTMPRFSLGEEFAQRVVRAAERERAGTNGQMSAPVMPAKRVRDWRVLAWMGGAGVAALVAVALIFAANQRGGTAVVKNPAIEKPTPNANNHVVTPDVAKPVDPAHVDPKNIVEISPRPNDVTVPLVNIGESSAEKSSTPVAVASIAKVRPTEKVVKPAPQPGVVRSEMLVLEIDATPEANRTLALAAAMAASKIRLESPLRPSGQQAEGEGVENPAPNAEVKPNPAAKVEYFVIEGERAHVEALVGALRGKQRAFTRVENPTSLADAIERLAVLDPVANGGEPLVEPKFPQAATVGVGEHSKSVGSASPTAVPQAVAAPNVSPQPNVVKPATQARAYRVSSPAAILGDEKSPGETTTSQPEVRVLLIVQNTGILVEGEKQPAPQE